MILECELCNKDLKDLSASESSEYYIYVCNNCQLPRYNTSYRQIFDRSCGLQAITLLIDDLYISWQYSNDKLYDRTIVYRNAIGNLSDSPDATPMTFSTIDWDSPVVQLNGIIKLPIHDLAELKEKIEIYTLFS